MKKKLLKTCCSLVIIFVLCYMPLSVFATSRSSLNSQMEDINNQIQQKQNEKEQIENEKSTALSEVEDLIYKISNYESEISSLKNEISSLESQINESQEKLTIEEENYKKQDEAMKERLIVIYENGETSFLDMLLGSSNLVDFISNYYLATEVAKADAEMLEEIEKKKNEIEAVKQGLEESKEKLEQKKASKEQTSQSLYETKRLKDQRVSELSADEKQVQEELEQFEAHKREIEAELRKIAEEEARKNGGQTVTTAPSACGYIKPVSGYSITTGLYYSSGKYHGAVDYSGSGIYGQPVMAVKAGTVVTSKAAINSAGNYYSYGEYIIINHHDGTMTLYAHGQAGSRKVSVGDTVSQGQVIMNVGSTGNSTGPHLHFEVRVNGSRVDPRPYLP